MMAINFAKSFIIGIKELSILALQGIVYIAPKLLLFFLFMIFLTVTGLFDEILKLISMEWINIDEARKSMNFRGFGG